MDREYIVGQMAENMKENILMIKNMVMVYIHIQTEDLIKDIGQTESNTEKDYL
jgi:hypothetical protein